MGEILVSDIETDGINASVIHCVGILNHATRDYKTYHGDEVVDGLLRLAEADLVIGHSFIGYDAAVIKDLTAGMVTLDENKIVDTLPFARRLFPQMPNHKLETWGEMLGLAKLPKPPSWKVYTPEMGVYCQRDVMVTDLLFDFLMSQLPPIEVAA